MAKDEGLDTTTLDGGGDVLGGGAGQVGTKDVLSAVGGGGGQERA